MDTMNIPASDRMVSKGHNGGPQLDMFPDDTILRNSKPRLIALSGRAGSGKSVVAQELMDRDWDRVKFADGLKNMLRVLYSMMGLNFYEVEDRIEGDLKETPDPYLQGRSPRHAMQTLGQEWGRTCISDDFWVKAWTERARTKLKHGYSVVVDDCRYANEADAIRKIGGIVVRVDRPNHEATGTTHASEQFDFEPDVTLINDGTVDDLIKQARETLL